MFVCKWDDALTGHAICFLNTFCSKVIGDSERFLQGKYKEHSGAFKDVCRGLKDSLEPFINGSSGLSAVCHQNTNLFDSLWNDEKFSDYCTWLKRNIYRIIASLVSMSQDCPDWDLSALQSASSAGPFKYGFVFTNGNWESQQREIQKYVSTLTGDGHGSLNSLLKCLKGEYSAISQHQSGDTTGNPGATAGGVFTGLFGLGGAGAGAAYATNAFGFQNFITGLLSSFLK